jgi:hypothetical protein
VGRPAAGWLFLATLYLTATTANVFLALAMDALWPALLATVLALVTVLCAAAAWRRT